jgi:hypothetical protein
LKAAGSESAAATTSRESSDANQAGAFGSFAAAWQGAAAGSRYAAAAMADLDSEK